MWLKMVETPQYNPPVDLRVSGMFQPKAEVGHLGMAMKILWNFYYAFYLIQKQKDKMNMI